jgi:hypothetical protein
MTSSPPLNPDLPPGIYINLDLRGSSAGIGNVAKRILLVGHGLPPSAGPSRQSES